LEDQYADSAGPWNPPTNPQEQAITAAATPWLDEPIHLEKSSQTEVAGVLAVPDSTGRELVPSLEVEVVEEPELVEVAQADPSLAEELELELTRIRERRAAKRANAAVPQQLVTSAPTAGVTPQEPDDLMEDPELLAGLLRVVLTP
jgi:hypothetical protein